MGYAPAENPRVAIAVVIEDIGEVKAAPIAGKVLQVALEKTARNKAIKLQLDLSKKYAIALEGGGAKGAYEIGVWQAFDEVGLQYEAVSGASVGALNGALMAMRDLKKAVHLWENITFSQVIDVDDEKMKAFFDKDMALGDIPAFLKDMAEVMKNKGFDSTPLQNLLEQTVDAEKIKQSDVDLYLVTYSLSDKRH